MREYYERKKFYFHVYFDLRCILLHVILLERTSLPPLFHRIDENFNIANQYFN